MTALYRMQGRKVDRMRDTVLRSMFLATLGALVLLGLVPGISAAIPLGCRFDTGSINPVSYSFFSVGSDYQTAFNGAANVWNNASVDPELEFQGSNMDPEVDVRDGWYFGNQWALAHTQCSSDGTFTGNDVKIEFNTKTMDSLSAAQKKLVAMHEIGHAYGLHEDNNNGNCRVMRQGTGKFSCTSSLPHSVEIAEVNSIN